MNNFLTVLRVVLARLRFVAVFIVAAIVVGYWDNIQNHIDKWTRPAVAPDALADAAAGDVEYYSVMHPWIVRSAPGNCPVCGMPLVKRKKGEAPRLPVDVLARVQLSPQRLSLANIGTTPVEYRPLVREIRTVGVLDFDETKVAHISARVAGRADQLFVNFTGQQVHQGDPVYSLYSPEVYTAMREYIQARKRVNELGSDAPPEVKADATAVYNASTQKLVLWGVNREQLNELESAFDKSGTIPTHLTVVSPITGTVTAKEIHTGHYVQVGEDPYTVTDLSTLWLQAKVFEQDASLIRTGQVVEVRVDAMPAESFSGVITYISFELNPDTRTIDARVAVDNQDGRLKPGTFATASVRVPVSAAAPVQSTTAPVDQAPDAFAKAMKPYTNAYQTLATAKMDGVWSELQATVAALAVIDSPAVHKLHAIMAMPAPTELEAMRKSFSDFSAAMIELGKSVGTPAGSGDIQVFHCPMRTDWLQMGGSTTNPYMGPDMLTCGSAVATLPKAVHHAPATQAIVPTGKVLSIPRSAVIDTGQRKIVYVQTSQGVFDMRAVQLGPAAGEYYPVLSGLSASDVVVTTGAFLVDSENRLNPAKPDENGESHDHQNH